MYHREELGGIIYESCSSENGSSSSSEDDNDSRVAYAPQSITV